MTRMCQQEWMIGELQARIACVCNGGAKSMDAQCSAWPWGIGLTNVRVVMSRVWLRYPRRRVSNHARIEMVDGRLHLQLLPPQRDGLSTGSTETVLSRTLNNFEQLFHVSVSPQYPLQSLSNVKLPGFFTACKNSTSTENQSCCKVDAH